MDASDEHINAWLEDLEPDEPLAVAQMPYEPQRRWNPLVLGVAAAAGVMVLGVGASKLIGGGAAPESGVDEAAQMQSEAGLAQVTNPTEAPADQQQPPATPIAQGPPAQDDPASENPAAEGVDGANALGIGGESATPAPNEPDPYDQTSQGEFNLTQHLVRAGNQWITHAGAEEAVRQAITKHISQIGDKQGLAVHAIQSLPLANIGRIVQVRAWGGEGVRSLWAVPVKDDGTVLASPWLVSSEQRPLVEEAPEPTGVVDKEEAVAVLTKAGWTNVEVAASGVHPSIPDILIVRANGIPPHGKQPVTSVLWLGGPAGARHVMGV